MNLHFSLNTRILGVMLVENVRWQHLSHKYKNSIQKKNIREITHNKTKR